MSDIKVIGVLGAGQMGGGIAQVAATTGYQVLLADVDLERATAGKTKIGKSLQRRVDKGKMEQAAADAILEKITPVASVADFSKADFAVEAATENIELKKKLFKAMDDARGPNFTNAKEKRTYEHPLLCLFQAVLAFSDAG